MSLFRVVMEVTTDDFDGLMDLFAEATASLEEHLPGTLAWETFADEASGKVLIYEVHRDESAANAYEHHMDSQGFVARAFELFTSARVIILSPVHESIWSAIAARPTSEVLLPRAGFSRAD